jgi:hypothetical protein
MTGSGKTNTAAKILEELMARGHRMIIFDSHDDYLNLERLSNLFYDFDPSGQRTPIPYSSQAFQSAIEGVMEYIHQHHHEDHPLRNPDFRLREWVSERLLQTASVIFKNKPARQIIRDNCTGIDNTFLSAISGVQPWHDLVTQRRVRDYRVFPELRFYFTFR